eukprot:11268855-Karenia_brevis.AAC.1
MITGTGALRGDPMDLGRIEEKEEEWEEEWKEEEEGAGGSLNYAGEKCNKCGGTGHYARECPSRKGGGKKGKGKGKAEGKGYGESRGGGKGNKGKGKGKGYGERKGPMGGCWKCGGDHYQSDCPEMRKSAAAVTDEIRHLSCIQHAPEEVGKLQG